MNILPFLHFSAFLVYLYLVVIVLRKNPKSWLNRTCAAMLACAALWSLTVIPFCNPNISKDTLRLFDNIVFISWTSAVSFFLWFSLIFAEKKKLLKTKIIYLLLFILPPLFIYKQWTGFFTTGYIKGPYSWVAIRSESIWYYLYNAYYPLLAIGGLYLIFNFKKKTKEAVKKKQAGIIFTSMLITFILAVSIYVLLPKLNIYSVTSLIALIWSGGLAYAIVRYKFMTLTPAIAAESIVETMSDSLLLVTPEGRIKTVNPATLNLLGYKEDELIDQPVEILFAGEKLSKGREFDDLTKKERVQNVEETFLSKDGRKIPVLFSSTIIHDDEGRVKGIVCIAVNIAEMKKAKGLIQEYDLLLTLMENIPDYIYFKDKKGRFIKVNKATAEEYNITPEEMIGKTDFDLFLKEKAEEYFADEKQIMESGKPLINKIENDTFLEGREHWSSTTKILRYNEKSEVIGTIGISRNITERKKAEEELRKTHEKLVRSEKLAVLGELTGTVGHELRNPLGAIKNSVYFLRMRLGRGLEDEKIKRHLDIMEEEINASDKIIADMLTFGRIKEPQLAPVNINDIVKDCLRKDEVPPNIKVSTQLNSQLPQIQADEAQLKEVFSNIILNAIQAMPKGGKLTITTARKDESIETDIADTGEGISKENLEKIFDPLFSTKSQGTGLGLSLCQSIIEGHKGAIEVKSEVGKGTKFIVKLPIH